MLLPLYMNNKDMKMKVLNSFSVHITDGYSYQKGLKVCSGSKKHYGVRNTSKGWLCISFSCRTHKNEPFPSEVRWTKALRFISHIVCVYPTFVFQPTCREGKETKEMLQVVTWHSVCLPWPEDDADCSGQGTCIRIHTYMDTTYVYVCITLLIAEALCWKGNVKDRT